MVCVQPTNRIQLFQQFGENGDIPLPGNYDGSVYTDIAVFRPSNATWYIQNPVTHVAVHYQFGNTGDIPQIPGTYKALNQGACSFHHRMRTNFKRFPIPRRNRWHRRLCKRRSLHGQLRNLQKRLHGRLQRSPLWRL